MLTHRDLGSTVDRVASVTRAFDDMFGERFNDGLLQIRVPKSPAAQPRTIPIGRTKLSANDVRENGKHHEG